MPPPAAPQPRPVTAPQVTARRLIARELGGEPRLLDADAAEAASAGERLVAQVSEGLSRSFGPYGALALVSRALTRAQVSHPMLSTVTATAARAVGPPGGVDRVGGVAGLAASASAVGGPAAVAALTDWLAQLADLLGGLIGDELAATLLEQSATSRTDGAVTPGGTFPAASGAGDPRRPGGPDHHAPNTVNTP